MNVMTLTAPILIVAPWWSDPAAAQLGLHQKNLPQSPIVKFAS
jgi:hypothetical protein